MTLVCATPPVDGFGEVVAALARFQRDGLPVQLHPGDLGWYTRCGADAAAAATRTWSRDGQILAVGLLDGPGVLRLAVSPDAFDDDDVATGILRDIAGSTSFRAEVVEARGGPRLRRALIEGGWVPDEAWTPLRRDLAGPVEKSDLRLEVTNVDRADVRVALQRASFERSTFTREGWRAMAEGPAYARARCLVGYDGEVAVAAVTVWSAGAGRPGLLEPMGVHREHRGRGYGAAICRGAAAALREMGASSATVCTPSDNVGAVATYASAGFVPLAPVRDFRRAV